MALLEERRKKLAAEGLFAEARKKPLPYLPRVIGVVTSPTGAVIRDILHRLADRFPTRRDRLAGAGAGRDLGGRGRGGDPRLQRDRRRRAVPRPDLIIVARGGGSLEDLWSFNEEIVVRAAAASAIPLISAVGHETDFTLIDFVADRRAPTPTGAAEMAVPVRSELVAGVGALAARHGGAMLRLLEAGRRELRAAARALPKAEDLLAIPRQRLDELAGRARPRARRQCPRPSRPLRAERSAALGQRPRTPGRAAEGDARRARGAGGPRPVGPRRAKTRRVSRPHRRLRIEPSLPG